jgi:formate hydrogenlyase transcriptional activator
MKSADREIAIGMLGKWISLSPQSYGFALVAVLLAAWIRYELDIALGFGLPFVLFYPLIMLMALFGGLGPGLFVTILSGAIAAYFFLEPLNSPAVKNPTDIAGLALFLTMGTLMSFIGDQYRRRSRRLEEFERAVEGVEEMIVVLDRDYRYLIANRAFLQYRGIKREEVIGRRVPDLVDPNVFEKMMKGKLDECFRGQVVQYEMRFFYPSRGERELFITIFPIEGRKGVERVACVVRDVTDQREAEAAVRCSEQRYRTLFEKSVAGVASISLNGRVLDCNDAWARMFGHDSAEECRGCQIADCYVDPSRREVLLGELKRDGAYYNRELELRRKDGTAFWILLNSVLLSEGLDEPVIQSTVFDITGRRQAEEALRRREEEYRQFVAQTSEGIFREDMDAPVAIDTPEDELIHHIIHDSYMAECNDAIARMYGMESAKDFVGKRLTEMAVADDPRNIELTREFIRSGFRVVDRESHETDIHGNPKVFRNSMFGIVEDGKLVRTWGIQRDVTEQLRLEESRQRAEEALRKSEAHFRVLVEQATDGIFIADAQGRYVDVNSAGAEMLGYTRDEVLQLSIPEIVIPEDAKRVEPEVKRFANGAVVRSEWMFRRKDGSTFPGEVSGKELPDGRIQGILRDMTDRRRGEEEMKRSEERFRVALKDSPITVFNQDRELRYTWIYNPQLYWHHEILGKTDVEILGAKKAAVLTALKHQVLKTGKPVREEVSISSNGKSYAFDATIEPLFDTEGNIVGITGACMDIARLREMADRLQDAKDRLAQEKSYLESEIQAELGFEEIIGRSAELREVLKKSRIVAPTDSTVLLLGETGTGKELVARSVHALSSRRQNTFVKLNCAAVPLGLLESELFGHEKGAFTSAVSQKVGRTELADKGTLFLDEIGELPLELQPKLLRVLQDREFERLGGVQTLRVNVRIIAATNRDLRQDVADKKFREDLFYRLNVFPIELPPLRERRGDIPVLVDHFVAKHSNRMGKRIDVIPDETMQVLENWAWPGNIRELENMIERMVILSRGRVLAAPPADLQAAQDGAAGSLTEMEREHIIRILRETNGVLSGVEGAANRLGVKRTTLQSMLKRFNIQLEDFRRGGNGAYRA